MDTLLIIKATQKINKGKKVFVSETLKKNIVEWYDYHNIPIVYRKKKNGYYVYKPSMLHWSFKKWVWYILISILSGFVLSCAAYTVYTIYMNIKF